MTATLVETASLEATLFEELIELTGETEPIRTAQVVAQVPGRIVELEMVEGEPVEEGDTVVRLNASQGRAQVDRLEVVVDQLETEIGRTERLIDRGLATEAQLEQLQAERNANREAIREVRAGVRETRHRAPIGGVVTKTWYEVGEFAGMGDVIGRIVDIDALEVRVGLPERDIEYVAEGLEVMVRIEATGEVHTGIVHRIGVEANPLNRTFPVEIHIDNADHAIRAGMLTTVVLVKKRLEDVVVIPRDVVTQAVDGAEVFLVVEQTAQVRRIELGASRGRFVVVTDGLLPGGELIVRGQHALVQGETIEVSRTSPCCAEQLESYLHGERGETR